MKDSLPEDLPVAVIADLSRLRARADEHLELSLEIMKAGERAGYPEDLIALAVIQRSLALIDGFALMVEHRNVLCAAPLVRMQIDSAMRLFACRLVDDPKVVYEHLLKDKPLHKLKTKGGHELRDSYLIKELGKIHPWMKSAYDGTSGFVHLSVRHFNAIWESFHDDDLTVSVAIGRSYGQRWKESEMVEAIDAFSGATTVLLDMCRALLRPQNGSDSQPAVQPQ